MRPNGGEVGTQMTDLWPPPNRSEKAITIIDLFVNTDYMINDILYSGEVFRSQTSSCQLGFHRDRKSPVSP